MLKPGLIVIGLLLSAHGYFARGEEADALASKVLTVLRAVDQAFPDSYEIKYKTTAAYLPAHEEVAAKAGIADPWPVGEPFINATISWRSCGDSYLYSVADLRKQSDALTYSSDGIVSWMKQGQQVTLRASGQHLSPLPLATLLREFPLYASPASVTASSKWTELVTPQAGREIRILPAKAPNETLLEISERLDGGWYKGGQMVRQFVLLNNAGFVPASYSVFVRLPTGDLPPHLRVSYSHHKKVDGFILPIPFEVSFVASDVERVQISTPPLPSDFSIKETQKITFLVEEAGGVPFEESVFRFSPEPGTTIVDELSAEVYTVGEVKQNVLDIEQDLAKVRAQE